MGIIYAVTPDDLIGRLLEIEVSALRDAGKGLPAVDPVSTELGCRSAC
jgi:hypothetical protein